MAARKNPHHLAEIRDKIRTSQLVNRLQAFALGAPDPNAKDGETKPCEIDRERLKAIEILLRKTLPDLAAVTIAGDPDKPLKTEEVGAGSAKLAAILAEIAERSGKAGSAA